MTMTPLPELTFRRDGAEVQVEVDWIEIETGTETETGRGKGKTDWGETETGGREEAKMGGTTTGTTAGVTERGAHTTAKGLEASRQRETEQRCHHHHHPQERNMITTTSTRLSIRCIIMTRDQGRPHQGDQGRGKTTTTTITSNGRGRRCSEGQHILRTTGICIVGPRRDDCRRRHHCRGRTILKRESRDRGHLQGHQASTTLMIETRGHLLDHPGDGKV